MAVSRVWVEWGPLGVIKIFKCRRDAIALEVAGGRVAEWPKGEAIKNLREQIFGRCNNHCELCGCWVNRLTGEMHEKHPRGKFVDGKQGEYSTENSIFICNSCHTSGDNAQHKAERWQTARIDK
jgi:hypothetical protein